MLAKIKNAKPTRETFQQTLDHFQQLFTEKKWLWGVVIGLVAASTILTYLVGTRPKPQITADDITLQNAQDLPTNAEDLNVLTVLLLGYGGAGHSGGTLSDVIQVARLDFNNNQLALIAIPRDSWVTLPGGNQNKINAAFSIDSGNHDENATTAKNMAQVVTGFPIDYYMAVDFVGFQRLIGEELGGIDVNVATAMSDPWYPIKGEELSLCGKSPEEMNEVHANYSGFELEKQFECRFEEIYYPAGVNHMQGDDALKYVRSRHGTPGGDYARGTRQQEVLTAIRNKLFSLEGISNIPRVFEQFATHIQTDLDSEIAEYLWPAIKASRDYEVVKVGLSSDNVLTGGTSAGGASIVQPKESWTAVQQYVQQQLSQALEDN